MNLKFAFENFKAFKKFSLKPKPLNIIFGTNSSGKSAVLQSLFLLKQSTEYNLNSTTPLLLNHPNGINLGKPQDVIFSNSQSKSLSIKIEIGEYSYEVSLGYENANFSIKRAVLKKGNEIIFNYPNGTQKSFRFFLPATPETFEFFDLAVNTFRKINYIGPVRNKPRRVYEIEYNKNWVGMSGENFADVLAGPKGEEVVNKINNWFERININYQLEVKKIDENLVSILLNENGFPRNLADVGFGFSQLIPVLTGTFINDGILLVEQPELHLHPRIQSELADFFLQNTSENSVVFLETHSENILNRIRRRIVENKKVQEYVNILFVERTEGKSELKEVQIDDYGKISSSFPAGFFSSDAEDIVLLMKSIAERSQKV